MASSVADNPKIAFVGTGAQGASIGADFALAGFDVTFIEQWPAHVEAIREKGITVNLPARTINARVPHFCQVAEMKETFDLIFLVVKAYDRKWVTHIVEPILARDGFVIGMPRRGAFMRCRLGKPPAPLRSRDIASAPV